MKKFVLQLCETYPKYLYVPSSCSNTVLMGSAKFRSKGRLPVLTYLHNNNKVNIGILSNSFLKMS